MTILEKIAETMDNNPELLKFENFELDDVKDITKEHFIKIKIFELSEKQNTTLKDGTITCSKQCWRSIEDLFLITKYYYPNTTFIEFMQLFYKDFIIEKNNKMFVGQFCNTIERRTFKSYDSSSNSKLYDMELNDEHGLTIPEWLDELKNIDNGA